MLRLLRLLRRNVAPTLRPSGSIIAGERAPARLAVHRVLDLHDVGAEPGQQLRRVGQRLHLLGGEDPHAVERLAVLSALGVGDVSEFHRRHSYESAVVSANRVTQTRPDRLTEPSGTIRGMRGIISAAGYVPYRRLDRGEIASLRLGGGKGTRSVASLRRGHHHHGRRGGPARAARRARRASTPDALWFSTAEPGVPRQEQRHRRSTPRCGSTRDVRRSTSAARCARRSARCATALDGNGCRDARRRPTCATACRRAPTSPHGGDGAAALLVGDDADGPCIAEYLGGARATEEFIERWRTPGSTPRRGAWEERFGEMKYAPLVEQAWNAALKAAELSRRPGRPS